MNDGNGDATTTFLFTSESVGEGHPGKSRKSNDCGVVSPKFASMALKVLFLSFVRSELE